MRLATKTRLVHSALLLLALWPLAHLALVWRYDLSPWKLGGWGMYSVPRFGLVGMEVFGRAADTATWAQLTAPSADVRRAGGDFLERHRWLRGLASPRPLADAVHASRPDWKELRVVVSYPVLDRTSAMVRLVTDERIVALDGR